MASKTFYRKYRPQSLNELDSTEIRLGLTALVKSGKTPHALLFTGPRGAGKTSAARILAKALNCPHKKSGYEPCNQCEICRSITAGNALDLIEVDAASNRGIDDIRTLREKIKLSPSSCRFKVYIIDEVHMLTTEAFNALLKTLEEPPAHAIFILCTTEPDKLPPTVVSRCLRFNFHKAQPAEVERCLKRVISGEKLKVEKGVVEKIAQSVDGSFRDAHKILEQLSLNGAEIKLDQANKLLQQTTELDPKKLLTILGAKDVRQALLEIDRIVGAGADLSIFVQQLLTRLRHEMLARLGAEEEKYAEIQSLTLSQIKQLIKLFSQAYRELKFSPIPQLPLELAAVDFCGQKKESSNKPKGNGKNSLKNPSSPPLPPSSSNNGELKDVKKKWSAILAGVKPLNHSVQALMRSCRPVSFDGKTLTLAVFYKFHKERLEAAKCRQIIEDVTSQILAKPVRMVCVLAKKEKSTAKPSSKEDIVELAANIFNGKIV